MSGPPSLVKLGKTTKGRHLLIDTNHFNYICNNKNNKVAYWLCTEKGCNCRLRTVIGEDGEPTAQLVPDITILPEHQHSNQLLKRAAKETEQVVIKKMGQGRWCHQRWRYGRKSGRASRAAETIPPP